jgi:hypothetical protein
MLPFITYTLTLHSLLIISNRFSLYNLPKEYVHLVASLHRQLLRNVDVAPSGLRQIFVCTQKVDRALSTHWVDTEFQSSIPLKVLGPFAPHVVENLHKPGLRLPNGESAKHT